MEEDLMSVLLGYAPLTSVAGSRVYWMRAPQASSKPYATLQVISRVPDVTHQGPSGLVAARVQVDCYGLTYSSAKGVSRAIEAKLSGFKGSQGVTVFDGIFKDAERDGYEDEDSPDKLFRVSTDYIIWHKGA